MKPIRLTLATLFGLIITIASGAIIWNYIPAFLWALIIAIIVWPVFRIEQKLFKNRDWLSALILTLVVAVLTVLPVFSILEVLIKEGQVFFTFLLKLDKQGYPVPAGLTHFPYAKVLTAFWSKNLSHPGGLSGLLKSLQIPIKPVGSWLSQVSSSIAHWFITLFFTLIALFFFLKEGAHTLDQIDSLGSRCLQDHWRRYWDELTKAMIATVNGTVMLGFVFGFLMGILYSIVGLPAPVLMGCITAILAMIPFGAILMSLVMGTLAYFKGGLIIALVVFAVGIILNSISDHVVRPLLLGNSTKLPFLAILFGILGGVELMGLLGLFLGPMIMVAFLSLWRSSTVIKS